MDKQKSSRASSEKVKQAQSELNSMKTEIAKAFIGQEEVVNSLMRALLCGGHVLLEGVPGIAKTLLIKSLAKVSGCSFKRIQFTADLLPTDIIGLTTFNPSTKDFLISKGPIFTNFIIADEINRSPPKTQSSLIEAMQEKQVTISKETFPLPKPFFVMANQNPIETEGVYSLPEAQIDRFLFKVNLDYPTEEDELEIMENNSTFKKFEDYKLKVISSPEKISDLQDLTKEIYLDPKIKSYILNIIKKTRTKKFKLGSYIELGCSPRASISIFIASKAEAVLNGRNFVLPSDVKTVVPDVLRHRLILTYKAVADKITNDLVIHDLMKSVHNP